MKEAEKTKPEKKAEKKEPEAEENSAENGETKAEEVRGSTDTQKLSDHKIKDTQCGDHQQPPKCPTEV